MPGESYGRWFRSLLLHLCDVFQVLITPLCWFYVSALGLILFQVILHKHFDKLTFTYITGFQANVYSFVVKLAFKCHSMKNGCSNMFYYASTLLIQRSWNKYASETNKYASERQNDHQNYLGVGMSLCQQSARPKTQAQCWQVFNSPDVTRNLIS